MVSQDCWPEPLLLSPVKSEFVAEEIEYFLIHIVTYFHHRLCSGEIEGWEKWQLALLGPREGWPGLLAMHTAGCLTGFCAYPGEERGQ